MPDRSSNRPTDPDQLEKMTVDLAAGEIRAQRSHVEPKNPAAVALGKLGGDKGGKARAAKLSPEQRHEIAVRAATARWKHDR